MASSLVRSVGLPWLSYHKGTGERLLDYPVLMGVPNGKDKSATYIAPDRRDPRDLWSLAGHRVELRKCPAA